MKYLTTKTYRPATVNLLSDVDRMFNQFLDAGVDRGHTTRSFPVDIAETADAYRIDADMPGFAAADVDVRVEDNLLVIEGKALETAEAPKEGENEVVWRMKERRAGSIKRSFVLPDDVDKSSVEAQMDHGVLSVTVMKRAEAKPFSVKVKGK